MDPFMKPALKNAKGIIIEHIVHISAAALNDSYVPLGKILRSQCLKFRISCKVIDSVKS